MKENRHYRVRTEIGEEVKKIDVDITQTYDVLDILSLKIDQVNKYNNTNTNYGIVVGRVIANGGLGIPNAKISVFIPNDTDNPLYQFSNTTQSDYLGLKYNLLDKDDKDLCHKGVGSMESKEYILENSDVLEVFDKFYKYTTKTNNSGDYMIYGVPTGQQTLHLDVDLSDIGILSQRPIDFIANGYSIDSFESPSKFKNSKNLNELVQIYQQDRSIQIYPYLGENAKPTITRCDFEVSYKFQTNCIFMGSIATDKGGNSIGKNCKCNSNIGRVSELTTSEGFIEMIRKTPDGKIEEFNIKGQRLIDGDGVWCYQIPMNLDYITTNEFGELIPTDNPNKGIATRTDVRFRFSLGDTGQEDRNTLRARYLIPHNPFSYTDSEEPSNDYEFGSKTRDESFRTLFMNNVYSVKSYIPYTRQVPSTLAKIFEGEVSTHRHTGIKYTSIPGDNNHIPYNSLNISLGFMYRFICSIISIIVTIIAVINTILSALAIPFCTLEKILKSTFILRPLAKVFRKIANAFSCIPLGSSLCNDGVNEFEYYPGCIESSCVWKTIRRRKSGQKGESGKRIKLSSDRDGFDACISLRLSESNEVLSYNFSNDWINGFLYFPLWFREVKRKRMFFGLFGRKQIQDNFCNADKTKLDLKGYSFARLFTNKSYRLKKVKGCALDRNKNFSLKGNGGCTSYCVGYEEVMDIKYGLIKEKETKDNLKVFYYSPSEWDKNKFVTLFATDIINLGPISGCSQLGINPFIDSLETTTYKMPYPILFTDIEEDESDQSKQAIEHSGASWSSPHSYGLCKNNKYDGGLFYDLSCLRGFTENKTCVNLQRICEMDVSIDETKILPSTQLLNTNPNSAFGYLISDGFISNDEIYSHERRSAFSTLNHNNLGLKYNKEQGRDEYNISYMYMDNFDGVLHEVMKERQINCQGDSYRSNYNLEYRSDDYVRFIYGEEPSSYRNNNRFYESRNSFYFFFGLKEGKTALNKYNTYFSQKCGSDVVLDDVVDVLNNGNSWCSDDDENERDGFVAFHTERLSKPYSFTLISNDHNVSYTLKNKLDNYFYIGNNEPKGTGSKKYAKSTIPPLANGSYSYIFEDVDGYISKGNFSLSNSFLNYNIKVSDFRLSNEDLDKLHEDILEIANNQDGFDPSSNKIRSYGGVLIVNNINKDSSPINSVKIEVKLKDKGLVSERFNNYNGIVINDGQIDGDGYLGSLTDNGDTTYYIGLPYPNVDYKVTVTELCDGVETQNSVTQIFSAEEFSPLVLKINGLDSRLFSKFKHNGDYNGWNDLKNVGKITTPVSTKALILNPNYEDNGEEPIYSYSEWYDELKPVYDYLTKQTDDTVPYSWVEGYYYNPNNVIKRVMSSKEEFIERGGIERGIVASELNKIISNRLTLQKKVDETFFIYHQSSYNSINITSEGGTDPYETIVIYSDSEYDDEKGVVKYKGRIQTKETQYYQNIPTLTKKNGKYIPYTDIDGNMVSYTSVANMDVDKTTTPRSIDYTDFKNGKDKDFLKLHFFDKQSKVNYNTWQAMRHIPYYKPTDKSKNGEFLDYGGFIAFTLDNFKITKTTSDGFPLFENLDIDGEKIKVKTLNSEEDFPTKRVLVNTPPSSYPNFNHGYDTLPNIYELNGFGEVLTVEDDTGNTVKVETKSNEYFGITKGSPLAIKTIFRNGVRVVFHEIPFTSDASNGTIYTFVYNGNNYIPYKIKDIKNYNEYEYMKFDEGMDLSKTGTLKGLYRQSDKNTSIDDYKFVEAEPDRQYFFILESDGNRFISPIYDFSFVYGKGKWNEADRTIEVNVTNLNSLYYLNHYGVKIIMVLDGKLTESEPMRLTNGKFIFSPHNFEQLYKERDRTLILIEDITGIRHPLM